MSNSVVLLGIVGKKPTSATVFIGGTEEELTVSAKNVRDNLCNCSPMVRVTTEWEIIPATIHNIVENNP